ncbi:MAG: hypothetical protein J6J43_09565 [Oscillospiraceae bacterium]|nr:hypothetical protein [Oscillospiraceae bacterium]
MKRKLLLSAGLCLTAFLLIPFLSVTFAGMAGMSICFLLFFAADPLICAVVGVLAGTDLPRLWWMPVAAAAAMPLCFCVCVAEFVPELYIYAAGYLLIGLLAMVITRLLERRKHHDESRAE